MICAMQIRSSGEDGYRIDDILAAALIPTDRLYQLYSDMLIHSPLATERRALGTLEMLCLSLVINA